MSRSASIERNTSETKIKLSIDLDGNGNGNIHTGIGFFDHMLNAFARHGFFDLDVEVEGDLYVDCHQYDRRCRNRTWRSDQNRPLEIRKGSNVWIIYASNG